VPEIEPAAVDDKVPIVTGEPKLPVASDNWAVKILPALKIPVVV
jgi:hypothetical protein